MSHHQQRRADPEDLPAEAGLSAGAGVDRPGDIRVLAGRAVPAAVAAGGPAVVRRCCCCRWRSALFAIFTLGLGLIVATANTFYRDCGHLISVFLQAWYFATPILFPIEDVPGTAQWRLRLNPAFYFIEMFHDILYAGQWPRIRPGGGGRRDRGGEPGNRLCHIQVPRRQDGLPTLTGAARPSRSRRRPGPADRAERRLASVRQLRRQAVLAQAGRARPGAAPRVAGARVRVLGAARHQLQDRPGRARRDRRRQRRRQEHAAPRCWRGSIRRRPARSRSAATSPR